MDEYLKKFYEIFNIEDFKIRAIINCVEDSSRLPFRNGPKTNISTFHDGIKVAVGRGLVVGDGWGVK